MRPGVIIPGAHRPFSSSSTGIEIEGDLIGVKSLTYGWSVSAVCVPDEVVRAVLASPGFVAALEERGIRAEPGGDVRLHGAVELLAGILAGGC